MKRSRYNPHYTSCLPSVPISFGKEQPPKFQPQTFYEHAQNIQNLQTNQHDSQTIKVDVPRKTSLNKKCLIKFDNRHDFRFLDLSTIFNEFSSAGKAGCAFSFLKKFKLHIEQTYNQRVLGFHWISNMKQGSEQITIGINSDSELFEVLSFKELSERLIQVTVAPSYII
jgi:hypothetical protein